VANAVEIELGPQLREFRARRNWTQADLARQLGTTAQTVSRWEQGSPPQPGLRRRLDMLLRDGPTAVEHQVIPWPLSPPTEADDEQLRRGAVAAAIARAGTGAAMSKDEVAFMRSLFRAVGLSWEDESD
jgi:transcriptional regulator with XRE-family HTH domain